MPAQPLTFYRAATLQRALETEVIGALPPTYTISVSLTPATETDAAQSLSTTTGAFTFKTLTAATEADAGQAFTLYRAPTLQSAREADSPGSFPPTYTISEALTGAVETDAARALSVSTGAAIYVTIQYAAGG